MPYTTRTHTTTLHHATPRHATQATRWSSRRWWRRPTRPRSGCSSRGSWTPSRCVVRVRPPPSPVSAANVDELTSLQQIQTKPKPKQNTDLRRDGAGRGGHGHAGAVAQVPALRSRHGLRAGPSVGRWDGRMMAAVVVVVCSSIGQEHPSPSLPPFIPNPTRPHPRRPSLRTGRRWTSRRRTARRCTSFSRSSTRAGE